MLVAQLHDDLGGADHLSAVQLSLVEAYAGASTTLAHINTQILAGAEINNALVSMHASAISALVRVASRLGLGVKRRTYDVSPPSAEEYFTFKEQRAKQKEQMAAAQADEELE